MRANFLRRLLAAAALFGLAAAEAQTVADASPDTVPPLRLAVVEGGVQFWRPGSDDWETAQLNTAVVQGDAVYTRDDGTAELQVGSRDFVRLRAGTMLTLVAHDPGLIQFSVGSGTASFDLRGDRGGQLLRIDTPSAVIATGERGYYRVSTRDGETRLAVRHGGGATVNFPDGRNQRVADGEEIAIGGDGGASVAIQPAPARDAWDQWNDDRSEYVAAAASNRYVPAGVYGASDLDQYGRWQEDSNYGWIWLPAVVSGWAPYSAGSWQWDPAFGWTWVDQAPWGWATCHYGRWVHVGGYWAWAPGPRTVRVSYAPALVAFFRVSGAVSWVALGWGEPLLPWWGRPGFRGSPWWGGWGGPRVGADIDHHRYRNRRVSDAMITVRDDDFGRRHVHGSNTPMPLGVEPRPVRGDHPIARTPVRDPAMRSAPRDSPRPDNWRRETRDPRQGAPLGQDRREMRPQIVVPAQRRIEAPPTMRQQPDRFDQRARFPDRQARPEVSRPAQPMPQPRVVAPAAPISRPQMLPPSQQRVQREQREERPQWNGNNRNDWPRGPHVRD